MEKPRFKHDCDDCVYLGPFERTVDKRVVNYDLYWCPSELRPNLASLIARYGNEPAQYRSSHPPEAFTAGTVPNEIDRETLARALVKGLYKPWERRHELEDAIRIAISDLACEDPGEARRTLEATRIKLL